MATKKVKKFGRGGDILTALGAGLAGYGVYKALNKDKDEVKERKDYLKDAIERAPKAENNDSKVVKPPSGVIFEEDRARDRALKQSKGQGNLVPEDLTEQDRNTLYESDKALVRTDDGKAKPGGGTNKPRIPPKAQVGNSGQGSNTTTGVDAGIEAGQRKKSDKPAAPTLKPGESRATGEGTLKPYPAAEAAKKKAEVRASKYTTPGDPNKKEATSKAGVVLGGSTVRSDKEKMGERAREVQRRREEEMKSRYKKGGAVKKMASGGMARSSASKRADGIAIRGKTRA